MSYYPDDDESADEVPWAPPPDYFVLKTEDFVMKSEGFTHPENSNKGLIFGVGRVPPDWAKESRRDLDHTNNLFTEDRQLIENELCWHCGLTAYQQVFTSYSPPLKILSTKANSGLWAMGSNWLLKDFPNDGCSPGNDYITHKFLRSQLGPEAPLISDMQLPLAEILHLLSKKASDDLSEQLFQFLRQIRRFTALGAQKVDGGKLEDRILGACEGIGYRPVCKRIGFTTDEWFENIAEELRMGLSKIHKTSDPLIIDKEFQKLKDNFPKPEPYVLTHCDLTEGNIIIKDGKISAIIDWEHAGYYPWWVERYIATGLRSSAITLSALPRLEPCMSDVEFRKAVLYKLAPVREAWNACKKEHPGNYDGWQRPPFSKGSP
ncbi:Protein kinase-like (PK-like) [Glarea lozoyensis ATCC 20868]|uniref:Protein kinase-like (PK-like) n=1 Tax=Glarea lozoyensis (strain ATCC 20868 / MF5171) TaxID=1116229 RepID=S3DIE0_GLAL2|nr:Protein kinase-like (PK-like) [Glarea lozoyensis ATCC 20868]EPE36924.1 Protein kinase-like (PK-like) [Glarea lozoyensis ATCC 20868]